MAEDHNAINITGAASPLGAIPQSILDEVQPRVREAALWLYVNRSTVTGNVLVALRRKFALTVLEATEPRKRRIN